MRAESVKFNLITSVLIIRSILVFLVFFQPFAEVGGPFLVDLFFLFLGSYFVEDKFIDEVRDVEPVHDRAFGPLHRMSQDLVSYFALAKVLNHLMLEQILYCPPIFGPFLHHQLDKISEMLINLIPDSLSEVEGLLKLIILVRFCPTCYQEV